MVGASISEASGEINGSSSILSRKRQLSSDGAKIDGEKRSTMEMDLEILDCPICYEALTIPIFQCDNGHLACSSCCPKLRDKCPVCASTKELTRCRAMETILESIFVPFCNAKFGCSKKLSYGKEKTSHEKECNSSQCSCPVQDCDYSGSYNDEFVLVGAVICGCLFSLWMFFRLSYLIFVKTHQNYIFG